MIATGDQSEPQRPDAERRRKPRPGQGTRCEFSYRVGKLAYEAYRAAGGGRDIISGEPLPTWLQLEQVAREAWHAAADAVWSDCVAMYRSRGGVL